MDSNVGPVVLFNVAPAGVGLTPLQDLLPRKCVLPMASPGAQASVNPSGHVILPVSLDTPN